MYYQCIVKLLVFKTFSSFSLMLWTNKLECSTVATFRLTLDSMPLMNALAYLSRMSVRKHLLIALTLWKNKLECSTGANDRLGLDNFDKDKHSSSFVQSIIQEEQNVLNTDTFLLH